MDKGIYCLVLRNPACTIKVGALGDIAFEAGWHIYIGSALGSGGLKRLSRHISFVKKQDRPPKWHVDYLLADSRFLLSYAVFATTNERLECPLAAAIGGKEVSGFGCSDCSCQSHLLYRRYDPETELNNAFSALGLSARIKTIMSREV